MLSPNETKFLAELQRQREASLQIIEDAKLAVRSYNATDNNVAAVLRINRLTLAATHIDVAFNLAELAVKDKTTHQMPTGANSAVDMREV